MSSGETTGLVGEPFNDGLGSQGFVDTTDCWTTL